MQLSIETEEDAAEARPPALGDTQKRDSFMLSQSGTFKLQDFAVNRHGISSGGGSSLSQPSPADSVGSPATPNRIDVRSLDELEMKEVRRPLWVCEGGPWQRSRGCVYPRLLDVSDQRLVCWMRQELGSGASGTVRRALHRPSGEAVAIKQVRVPHTSALPGHEILRALQPDEERAATSDGASVHLTKLCW